MFFVRTPFSFAEGCCREHLFVCLLREVNVALPEGFGDAALWAACAQVRPPLTEEGCLKGYISLLLLKVTFHWLRPFVNRKTPLREHFLVLLN